MRGWFRWRNRQLHRRSVQLARNQNSATHSNTKRLLVPISRRCRSTGGGEDAGYPSNSTPLRARCVSDAAFSVSVPACTQRDTSATFANPPRRVKNKDIR